MSRSASGSFVLRLWISVGSGLLLLGAIVGHSVYESFQQHEEQGRVEILGASRALRSDLDGAFARVDLALRVAGDEYRRESAASGIDPAALGVVAAKVRAAQSDIDALRIFDATGRVVATSEVPDAQAPVDAGSGVRELIGRMASDPTAKVVLAGPFGSPAGGWPMIVVAHRLDRPDGGYAGVVTADIALDRIAGLLGAAWSGPRGEASLYSPAFALLARFPTAGQQAQPGAPASAELARHAAEGLAAGTFVETSAIDGRERRVAFQRLAAHGLVATVARVRSEQLAHFRHDAVLTVVESVALAVLAIGMAIMIQRSWQRQERASRELERLARTDALTGLANRRRFFELAETELARAGRYGSPLSVLMIDIDHFKDVNDACGHATGDLVLRQLAGTCRTVLRQVDTVGRVGGEEFAVLLPETSLAGAVEVADRLRSAVQSARVPREEGEPIAITVSVGVATSAPGKSVDDLMSQSDTALYEAKRTGRNRVLAWQEPVAA